MKQPPTKKEWSAICEIEEKNLLANASPPVVTPQPKSMDDHAKQNRYSMILQMTDWSYRDTQ